VAGRQYLNQISAQIRDDAVGTLSALLRSKDDEDDGRCQEALEAAPRDVVARTDPEFQVNALAAALARIVADQQQEIATLKRTKANAATLASKAGKT
jgi:hypothetical protein